RKQRPSSAVIAPVLQTAIRPDTATFPATLLVTIKINRTTKKPIALTTTFGDRSKIIATVTSRASKPATRQVTNASSSTHHCRPACTVVAAPAVDRRRQLWTRRRTRTPSMLTRRLHQRIVHSAFHVTPFSHSNC